MRNQYPAVITFMAFVFLAGAAEGPTSGPSEPRSSLREFSIALMEERAEARDFIYAGDDPLAAMGADAHVRGLIASFRVARLAREMFERDQVDAILLEQRVPTPEAMQKSVLNKLDAAIETIEGDDANIVIDDPMTSPFPMRKIDGRWKIVAPSQRQEDLDLAMRIVERTETIAHELESGKIVDLPDFRRELENRTVFVGSVSPLTRPTTQPR